MPQNNCRKQKSKNNKRNHHNNHNNHQNQQHKHQEQQQQQHQNHEPEPETKTSDSPSASIKNDPLYEVEKSNIVGRYLVASRDLKPGEHLIRENPIAIGPCPYSEPVCLGCYMPVTLSISQYRCPECKWPLCGPKCRGLGQIVGHTSEECIFLKNKNCATDLHATSTDRVIKNLYELIMIIRILLAREQRPIAYEQIMRMESHVEERKKNQPLWQHYETNVVRRIRNEWEMTEFSEEEIHNICGIIDVNCFEIGQKMAKARCLYPSAFLLAHDCRPNTSHTDDPDTYAISLRTSTRITKGEAITLSYAYTLQGTLKRREFMFEGKLFWCSCQRCADPTEFGTDCSALICPSCTKGSMRSTQPLDQDAIWQCDGCENSLKAETVVKLLDKIYNDLESIDAHNIPGLEEFMKRYRKVLRPNHYLFLSAKYSLCQIYGRTDGYLIHEMSMEDIKRKEQYCRDFLSVIDILEPGLTRLRGLILYELHAPIMITSTRQMQTKSITKQHFQRNMKEVVKLLRESRDILKMEPIGSNEYQMGEAAEDALLRMGNV